jgi:hypothetical protein
MTKGNAESFQSGRIGDGGRGNDLDASGCPERKSTSPARVCFWLEGVFFQKVSDDFQIQKKEKLLQTKSDQKGFQLFTKVYLLRRWKPAS